MRETKGTVGAAVVPHRFRRVLRAAGLQILLVVLTLIAIEFSLRAIDLRYLRLGANDSVLPFAYDQELGWFPVPNSTSTFSGIRSRVTTIRDNSLGLRDIEPDDGAKPTILVLGDSFVWGYAVEAEERLTEFVRQRRPDYRVVNAGVAGYGTDQAYLLLRRLWERIKPDIVVLVTFYNDHDDNSANWRHGAFKPYFEMLPQGGEFRGQPVPKTAHYRFKESGLAQKSLLVRAALMAYVQVRYSRLRVPDPTERLIEMTRDFVQAHGAKFLVGELDGNKMAAFFQSHGIPYVSLDEPPGRDDLRYKLPNGGLGHWTPAGHAFAGAAILHLLEKTGAMTPPPIPAATLSPDASIGPAPSAGCQ
jgi:hypothetical protein